MSLEIKKGHEDFWGTFQMWPVNEEWAVEMYNYVMKGFQPGSFHTAVFANSLIDAAAHSHPGNDWSNIVAMVKWIHNCAPRESFGSYADVEYWLNLHPEQRDEILYDLGYKTREKELVVRTLKEPPGAAIPCPGCGGRGKHLMDTECPECKGTGTVYSNTIEIPFYF